jgi:hypothetical protein
VLEATKETNIKYLYDAQGNRVVKQVFVFDAALGRDSVHYTYYVRDAQGNVLSIYSKVGYNDISTNGKADP